MIVLKCNGLWFENEVGISECEMLSLMKNNTMLIIEVCIFLDRSQIRFLALPF